jgi:hypothetical protein
MNNDVQSAGYTRTLPNLLSLEAFHAVLWLGVSICILAYSARVCIRYVCHKRLLVDDLLMLVALMILIAIAAMGQVYLTHLYNLNGLSYGTFIPGPTFLDDSQTALRAFGAMSIMCYVGIWIVKINFMVIFYRLGNQINLYRVFWWIVFAIIIACFIIELAVLQYDCVFGNITYVITVCTERHSVLRVYRLYIVACALDVLTDVLLICFPVTILWRTRLSLRQKVVLSLIFSLVGFTIAVTIIRGSIFGGAYRSIDATEQQDMSTPWIWLWFSLEYIVSFLIACLVSFRSLFMQKAKPNHNIRPVVQGANGVQPRPRPSRRIRRLYDSVLETCRTLEGTNVEREHELLPRPPTANLGLDFSKGSAWTKTWAITIESDSQSSRV